MKVSINLVQDNYNSYPESIELILEPVGDDLELTLQDRTIRVNKEEILKAINILLEK